MFKILVNKWKVIFVVLSVLSVLFYCSRVSYAFFHSIAELFTIVIAVTIFVIAWSTRYYAKNNNYLFFIGFVYLFISVIDLFHTLSYKGLNLFSSESATNLASQFWVIARYIEALAFLIAPFYLKRKVTFKGIVLSFGVLSGLLLLSLYLGVFPHTYIENKGLTGFKILSEFIISSLFIVSIIFLNNKRCFFKETIFNFLVWALIAKIISEFAFSLFIDPYGFLNFTGHIFKIASFFLLYKAVVESNINQPYTDLRKEIDHRQKIEENLLLFKNLIDQTQDAIFIVHAKLGRIIDVNSAASLLVNHSVDELKAMTIKQVDILDVIYQFVDIEFIQTEKEFYKINGDKLYLEINARYVKYNENDYYVVVIKDITERKNSEINLAYAHEQTTQLLKESDRSRRALLSVVEDQKMAKDEIQKLNQNLEERVVERTMQLEAANKELEAFSYSVSHDLRAPLRHINGFISLFLQHKTTELTAEEIDYLNVVTKSATEMGELIDALLSFSRLSRSEIQKVDLDNNCIIDNVLQLFDDEVIARNIQIKKINILHSKGDLQLMRQVWINLLSNAVKYTRNTQEANIEINSYREDDQIVFYVKDNGSGFNMKYAAKLFGVFQRLHKARDFEGVGIGLANVNRIITRHGGKCWAEGEVDVGATFYFSLPD